MQFYYKGFVYSVLNETLKTAAIGNTSSTLEPNAVDKTYSSDIVIPSFVYHSNKKYEVVEISWNAFNQCNETKHLTIPGSIIALRRACFHGMTSVETFEIKGASRLETIELHAFARMYKLKSLVLPYYAYNITQQCFACLLSITDIYICCITEITSDVFRDYRKDDLTNPNLVIHVPKMYNGTHFGSRTNLTYDDFFQKCSFSSYRTCKQRNNQRSLVTPLFFMSLLLAK